MLTRTYVIFINFQDIEAEVIGMLGEKKFSFGINHNKGITTLLIEGKIERQDLMMFDEHIVQFRYEVEFEKSDDPNDIVDTLGHNLSGLIDS